jgi:regulator of sigma E protease
VTWLVAIVALCVVIIVHELGHYLAAVWTGMKVDRFSVFGIGPAIVKLGTWRGTEFVIGAIPFGAYVLIRGMEPEDPQAPTDPATRRASENFRDKPLLSRLFVIAGGPLANYVAAMLLYFGVFAGPGMPGPLAAIEVAGVHDGSIAAQVGLQEGDELVSIAGTEIDPARKGADVVEATRSGRGYVIPIVVRRDGELVQEFVGLPDEEGAMLGIDMRGRIGPREQVGLGTAASEAVRTPLRESGRQLEGLYLLVTGQLEASMQGPVGIVKEIARSADAGLISLITTAAFISTLLGLFNLLPLPALDGGRLCFLVYEGLARRRANPRVEELVHGYGMMALLALILLVTVGDVRRLF